MEKNTSSRAKLDVWEKFGVIKDCENSVVSGCAACEKYQKILAFDSCKPGKSLLRKHSDSCSRGTGVSGFNHGCRSGHGSYINGLGRMPY